MWRHNNSEHLFPRILEIVGTVKLLENATPCPALATVQGDEKEGDDLDCKVDPNIKEEVKEEEDDDDEEEDNGEGMCNGQATTIS